MERVLILDLNVIRYGLEDTSQEWSLACRVLLEAIVSGEWRIAWSHEVMGLYMTVLHDSPSVFPNLTSALRSAIYDGEKFIQVLQLIDIGDTVEAAIKDRPDLPFVRLAATVDDGCILATTDEPLRTSVAALGLPARYKFHISDPVIAVGQLG